MTPDSLLELFQFQYSNCPPYKQWCELLGILPSHVDTPQKIPFLPIEFFRTHNIYTAKNPPELTFSSSGTTSAQTSTHAVAQAQLYIDAFTAGFRQFYGNEEQYSIFALLPGYLERPNSSLAYMVEHLHAKNPTKGGYFLNNFAQLEDALKKAALNKEKIFLIGVTFAMVDFARSHHLELPNDAIIMETGGMKGRGVEIERNELHSLLKNAFSVTKIHSEYGMTELLSQAYSKGDGLFHPASTMKIVGRSLSNPLESAEISEKRVGLNIIDTANRYSCSFLATGDCGRVFADGSFEVFGRIEGEILRGCNMLT